MRGPEERLGEGSLRHFSRDLPLTQVSRLSSPQMVDLRATKNFKGRKP